MAAQNQILIRRANLSAHLIGEHSDLMTLVLRRSQKSYDKLTNLIQQLTHTLAAYNQHDPMVVAALQELQAEQATWADLDKCLSVRKSRLDARSSRLRNGKIKRFNRHHLSQQTRFNLQENIEQTTKSEGIKTEGSLNIANYELEHKMKLREEFYTIKEFITRDLAPMLQYAKDREVPKKVILNIYMNWNQRQSRQCLIEDTGKMQMELTNQLKICFPRISMNRKAFKGIFFRGTFAEQLELTDRSPPFNQDGLDYHDPVNELLREANELLAEDTCDKSNKEEDLKDLDHELQLQEDLAYE